MSVKIFLGYCALRRLSLWNVIICSTFSDLSFRGCDFGRFVFQFDLIFFDKSVDIILIEIIKVINKANRRV